MPDGAIYSEQFNLRFHPISKNAMTSVINTLNTVWVNEKTLPSDHKQFCVIRDPLDRAISGYFYTRGLYTHKRQNTINQHNFREMSPDKLNLMYNDNNIEKSIGEYFKELKTNGPFDGHNDTQESFIHFEKYKNYPSQQKRKSVAYIDKIDYFLDFSKLNDHLNFICNKKVNLKHINSQGKNQKVKNIIKKYENIIKEVYACDYELLKRINI